MGYGGGNPQLEDGFAPIANEILEAIARTTLTDYESRCIHWLWRKTYGWHNPHGKAKKTDAISYGQWAEGTAIDRRTIWRTLESLVKRKVITKATVKKSGRNPITVWGFQKKYKDWVGYISPEVSAGLPIVSGQGKLPEVSAESPTVPVQVSAGLPTLPVQVSHETPKVSAESPIEVSAGLPITTDKTDNSITTDSIGPHLKILGSIKKYPFDEKKDAEHLKNLLQDFPQLDLLKVVKALRDYYVDNPLNKKSSPRLRLRNFCEQEMKYMETHPKGKGKQSALPTTEELEESWGVKAE